MRKPKRRSSWKQLLGQHGPGFLRWQEEERFQIQAFNKISLDLETYLLSHVLISKDACEIFASNLPLVIEECNECIYDNTLMPDSYAFVHLQERYRRFWGVLKELTAAKVLPMKKNGINALDIGTGPAPALYAISDYYEALHKYAGIINCPEIDIQEPCLESVESSREVPRLLHMFSEIGLRRRGPFHVTFNNFKGLDLASHRSHQKERRIREIANEDDSDEYYAQWWINEYEPWWDGVFRYNLCVLSYFLTEPETVSKYGMCLAVRESVDRCCF